MADLAKLFFVLLLLNYISSGFCKPKATATTTQSTAASNTLGLQRTAPSGIYILISLVLKSKVKASTDLMLKKYTFINRSSFLIPPIIRLGLQNTGNIDCRTMSSDDKFKVLYSQFLAFEDPVKLACDYEAVPSGSKNNAMSKSLNITRIYLQDTVYELREILTKRKVPIPSINKVTESSMNSSVTWFLTELQKTNLGVAPTDSNVKIYRNYVILNTLMKVILSLKFCIPE